jgi:hypothetical protein
MIIVGGENVYPIVGLTGEHLGDIPVGAGWKATTLTADGTTLVTGDYDGGVGLWDPASGRAGGRLSVGGEGPLSVAVNFDASTIAAAGDKTVTVWQGPSDHTPTTLNLSQTVASLAMSPDGYIVAIGSFDGTVLLWNLAQHNPAVAISKICHSVNRDLTPQEWHEYLPQSQSISSACSE